MQKLHAILAALVGSAALAGVATAAGASAPFALGSVGANGCPKATAQIVGDPSLVLDYSPAQPEGRPLTHATISYPGHFYELLGPVELRFRGNTVTASSGSILKLTCYAASPTSRKLPAIGLLRGTLKVTTAQGDPAGVLSEEGLFDPRSDPTIVFTVKRVLTKRGELTTIEKMRWFASFANQPMGTTTIASASVVGVTPYVGAERGTCRYVHFARLTTTRGYGTGTATYKE